MKQLAFQCFLIFVSQIALAAPNEVEFRNGGIYFRAAKSATQIRYSDESESRDISIKKCNQKLVETFWDQVAENVKAVQILKSDRNVISGPWLKVEGIQFQMTDVDSTLSFFNKIPVRFHVLAAESFRLCQSK